jgi:hypothetical protein
MTAFATTRMTILDPLTAGQVGACAGPEPDGRCSQAVAGARIACAGHPIRCEIAGESRRLRLFVPAGLNACPMHQVPHPWAG